MKYLMTEGYIENLLNRMQFKKCVPQIDAESKGFVVTSDEEYIMVHTIGGEPKLTDVLAYLKSAGVAIECSTVSCIYIKRSN